MVCLCCHDQRNHYVLCRNGRLALGVASLLLLLLLVVLVLEEVLKAEPLGGSWDAEGSEGPAFRPVVEEVLDFPK